MIQDFTDLIVWQKAHSLVIEIYKIVKRFPKDEQFGISSQMRRAAVSITSNIAEGFGRNSTKEKVQFYHLSMGSLVELRNQVYICRDVGYIDNTIVNKLVEQLFEVQKILYGLLRTSKNKI